MFYYFGRQNDLSATLNSPICIVRCLYWFVCWQN